MPFVPILNTVEVKLFAQRGGKLRLNVFHYGYDLGPPNALELSALAADIETFIVDKYEDFVAVGTQWYQIVLTDISTATGATWTRAINRVSAGSLDDLPGNCSYVLSKRTGAQGRSKRGRFYLIDLPEDFFNGDLINPFVISAVNSLIGQLVLPRQAGRFVPVVASPTLGTSQAIVAITHDGVADSQRRRLTGRGA